MKMFRVTEVLSPYTDFSRVPPDRLEAAQARGTAIHDYLHSYLLDLYSPMPEEYRGYCESGERWIKQNVLRVVSAEREYRDEKLGFYGHPDAVVELITNKKWIPDWKSPVTESKSWRIQLAAYKFLVLTHHRVEPEDIITGALMLAPKGGVAKMKRYEDRWEEDFSIFLGLLNAARYFNIGERK